jgi:hypothetical protein
MNIAAAGGAARMQQGLLPAAEGLQPPAAANDAKEEAQQEMDLSSVITQVRVLGQGGPATQCGLKTTVLRCPHTCQQVATHAHD